MREYGNDITDFFTAGLRTAEDARTNVPGMTSLNNLEPFENGVRRFSGPDYFEIEDYFNWPFPQVFRGIDRTWVLTKTAVYQYLYGQNQFQEFDDIKKFSNTASTFTVTGGGSWHFADHGQAGTFCNGSCILYFSPWFGPFRDGVDEIIVGTSRPIVNTITAHRGRTVVGGFDQGAGMNQGFFEMLRSWVTGGYDVVLDGIFRMENQHWLPDEHMILWSSVGGNLMWLWETDYATRGITGENDYGYSSATGQRRWFHEQVKQADLGWMPVPEAGSVVGLSDMDPYLLILGTEITRAVRPVQTFGYGFVEQRFPGCISRSAWCRGLNETIYISNEGYLIHIGRDLEMTNLGYREFFDAWTDLSLVAMSYDNDSGYFYIGNGEEQFVLKESSKLFNIPYRITGVTSKPSGESLLYGRRTFSLTVEATTEWMDFGYSGNKKITWILFRGKDLDHIQVTVGTRYEQDGEIYTSRVKDVNKEGAVFVGLSGKEFKIQVEGLDPSNDVEIHKIEVRVQPEDKTYYRGIRASTSAADER